MLKLMPERRSIELWSFDQTHACEDGLRVAHRFLDLCGEAVGLLAFHEGCGFTALPTAIVRGHGRARPLANLLTLSQQSPPQDSPDTQNASP